MSWPPKAEAVEEQSWTASELRYGDLIFCARDGGLLTGLGRVSGEPWRHVGSITHNDAGEKIVVENIGPKFVHRTIDEFFDKYDSFGAARLDLAPECVAAANNWMSSRVEAEGDQVIYAWDDLILAGLIAVTKRGVFVGRQRRVRAAIEAAAKACKDQLERHGKASLTCSAFVQLAYDESGGDCRIQHQRWRSSTPEWPPKVDSIDEFLADDIDLVGYEDVSIADLLLEQERHDRYINPDFTMPPDQLGELARVLLGALKGGLVGDTPDALSHDGRWVTPGDLWDSVSVARRGKLRVG